MNFQIPPVAELRQIVFKSQEIYGHTPFISRAVIHPYLSIHFTRIFLCIGMTGNQVTLLMAFFALIGAALFFVGGVFGYVVGASMMLLSWILDHSDGEVLRYRKQSSSLGVYLDCFTHRASYPLMHIGTGFSLWQASGNPDYQLFGALVAYCWQLGVEHRLDKVIINQKRGDIDLKPMQTFHLAVSDKFPHFSRPLKWLIIIHSNCIQHTTFALLMIISALCDFVTHFYIGYGTLLIGTWFLNTTLDFGVAFRSGTATVNNQD